jgi:hypothetical protein
MNLAVEHISAKKVLDWYIERLEEDETAESKDALQYINLQLMRYKANTTLNTLYSYPIGIE